MDCSVWIRSNDDTPSWRALVQIWSFRKELTEKFAQSWLCHSLALTYLEGLTPCNETSSSVPNDAGCGPMAFAALAGVSRNELAKYFPDVCDRSWTNRRDMENAFRAFGLEFKKQANSWPTVGLCLIHWTGPWSSGHHTQILKRTHWVAVIDDYVFDINWQGWLPKENWEDVVVDELLRSHPRSNGWTPLTAYEIECPSSRPSLNFN